jgi:RNA polymerase sigma-70 factor (ECF subfamily)
MNTTPASLLERLRRPDEPEAWERFVRLYTPLLYHWARRLGSPRDNASDLVQEVLTLLVQKLPTFAYDKDRRFRAWLWTVTLNQWRTSRRRHNPTLVQGREDALVGLAVPDDAEAVSEAEYRQFLVGRAMTLMQSEFQPSTWQAFWQCVVCDQPGAEVARALGLTENAVYLAKGRVLRRLREELDGLLE